jgi:hypothetical protein
MGHGENKSLPIQEMTPFFFENAIPAGMACNAPFGNNLSRA